MSDNIPERYQFKEGELTLLFSDFTKMDIADERFFRIFKEGYRLGIERKQAELESLRKERDDLLKWLDYEIQEMVLVYNDAKRIDQVRDGALYRAGALSHVKEKLIRTEQTDKPPISHE